MTHKEIWIERWRDHILQRIGGQSGIDHLYRSLRSAYAEVFERGHVEGAARTVDRYKSNYNHEAAMAALAGGASVGAAVEIGTAYAEARKRAAEENT